MLYADFISSSQNAETKLLEANNWTDLIEVF